MDGWLQDNLVKLGSWRRAWFRPVFSWFLVVDWVFVVIFNFLRFYLTWVNFFNLRDVDNCWFKIEVVIVQGVANWFVDGDSNLTWDILLGTLVCKFTSKFHLFFEILWNFGPFFVNKNDVHLSLTVSD